MTLAGVVLSGDLRLWEVGDKCRRVIWGSRTLVTGAGEWLEVVGSQQQDPKRTPNIFNLAFTHTKRKSKIGGDGGDPQILQSCIRSVHCCHLSILLASIPLILLIRSMILNLLILFTHCLIVGRSSCFHIAEMHAHTVIVNVLTTDYFYFWHGGWLWCNKKTAWGFSILNCINIWVIFCSSF